MTSHRTIRSVVAVAAFGLCACAPTAAQASSLLSGYGGPGQGNQAILGSGLLNAPKGGSGGGSASTTAASTAGSGANGGSAAGNGAHKGHAPAARHASGAPAGSSGAGPLYVSSGQLEKSRAAASGTSVLGLSGTELLLSILGLVLLALIGALTLWLARAGRHTGTGPKEIRAGARRVTE